MLDSCHEKAVVSSFNEDLRNKNNLYDFLLHLFRLHLIRPQNRVRVKTFYEHIMLAYR